MSLLYLFVLAWISCQQAKTPNTGLLPVGHAIPVLLCASGTDTNPSVRHTDAFHDCCFHTIACFADEDVM